jgi:hypothetical protein
MKSPPCLLRWEANARARATFRRNSALRLLINEKPGALASGLSLLASRLGLEGVGLPPSAREAAKVECVSAPADTRAQRWQLKHENTQLGAQLEPAATTYRALGPQPPAHQYRRREPEAPTWRC